MASKIKFSQQDLDMISQRLSLVDFIGKRVTLKRRGNDFWGCCPFHGEKTPSFHVREDKKYYHCFGCGEHGNIFNFAMFVRGGTFPETVEYLAQLAGVELERTEYSEKDKKIYNDSIKSMELATKLFQKRLKETPKAQNYIKNRNLSAETIKVFKLGYAKDSWNDLRDSISQKGISIKTLIDNGLVITSNKGGYDRFRDRIMFPIENYKNQTIAFGGRVLDKGEPKYLNSPETKLFNKRYNLYALNVNQESIRKENKVFIVEGYMDVIGLYDKGIKLAVAPLGTAITKEQILTLWRYNSSPIVCLDGDNAGQKAALRLAKNILSELQPGRTLRFMSIPNNEDPDSYVAKYGAKAFLDLSSSTFSIIQCLWKDLILNKNKENPDDIALLKQEINSYVKEIQNPIIKQQYQKTFNDLVWDFTKKSYRKKEDFISNHKKGASIAKKALKQKQNMDECLILALSLQYPEHTLIFEEQFAETAFCDHEHKALKKALIDFLEKESLDKESLNNYLNDMNLMESKNRVLKSCSGILNAEFKEKTAQDIKKYWQELHQNLQNSSRKSNRSHNKMFPSQEESFDSEFMENITKMIKKGK